MAPEHEAQKKVGRKLTKRRKPVRASSVQYPERLKVGEDAQEDVTAAKGNPAQHMNQSVFSMIAAAGSKTNFHARFEGESSDSEEDQEPSILHPPIEEPSSKAKIEQDDASEPEATLATASSTRQSPKIAESRHPRTLPKLKLRTAKERNYMSQSVLLPPKEAVSHQESSRGITPRDAPVMSKMLEAQAKMAPSSPSVDMSVADTRESGAVTSGGSSVSLATRLMEIFGFEGPEEVISGKTKTTAFTQSAPADTCRIPMLASAKRSAARLHVHNTKTHLFLRVFAKEIRELFKDMLLRSTLLIHT